MPRHKLVVLSNPVPGQDDAFNTWYDTVHLADVLKVEGVTGATRFKIDSDKWRYLAIYELECDDPQAVRAELLARSGTSAMPMDESFDLSNFHMAIATPC